jgi:hypothetical protein
MSICLIWSTTLRTLRLWQKLVVEIPEPLATQQFFTGPQVMGTSWYNNPESLAKARINILMWRAIQLYNLPQGKVPSTQRTSLWLVTKLVLIVLLTSMANAAYFFRHYPSSLKSLTDLWPFHPQFLLHIHLAKRFGNSWLLGKGNLSPFLR